MSGGNLLGDVAAYQPNAPPATNGGIQASDFHYMVASVVHAGPTSYLSLPQTFRNKWMNDFHRKAAWEDVMKTFDSKLL